MADTFQHLEALNLELTNELTQKRGALKEIEEERDAAQKQLEVSKRAVASAQQLVEAANQKARDAQDKLRSSRESYEESKETLRSSLARTRDKLKATSELWGNAGRYYSLFWQGLLADEISKSDIDLGADTYLSLLPSTVPAAMALRREYGGRIICDCVENVEVERQSLAPKLHPTTLDMVNLTAYGALSIVDGLMTVSHAVGETLSRFGPPVRVQPNYRRYEEPTPAGKLREKFKIPQSARVLVATGGIVGGFGAIVKAMARVPHDVHLVAFAKFSPSEYDSQIRELIASKGLESRIHLNGFVPYETLSPLLADADAGLIVLDPLNPNHSVSLPNRVFDFTSAALPFVSPDIAEIREYIERFECGVVIDDVSPESWASAIVTLLDKHEKYRKAILRARPEVTWESSEDELIDFLGNPRTVTLLGFRDLSRYQRFLRIADTLTARGIEVKAAFFSTDPRPIENADVNFYHFSDRYGRGPGLRPVPYQSDLTV